MTPRCRMHGAARLVVLAALGVPGLETDVRAQTRIFAFDGDFTNSQLGTDVANWGDANGDGVADLVAGAFADSSYTGLARVFSGWDGSILQSFRGTTTSTGFGYAVDYTGDLDLDGGTDIVVGAYLADSASVFSGTSGALLYTYTGPSKSWFGLSVAGGPDVDGDGIPEFMVGAPVVSTAFVYSGGSGALRYTFQSDSGYALLGHSLCGAGDIDGDSVADLAIGAPGDGPNLQGSVRVFSGADGTKIQTVYGSSSVDRFAFDIAAVGDLDLDQVADLLVGVPYAGARGSKAGRAEVRSLVTGATLWTDTGDMPGANYGQSVGAAGDLDGDSSLDWIVGAYNDATFGPWTGKAKTYSGSDGSLLFMHVGDFGGQYFALGVAGGGDMNGDGYCDVAVGSPGGEPHGSNSGVAEIFSGSPIPACTGSFATYGSGVAGSWGRQPWLAGPACPSIGSSVAVNLSNGLGGTAGIFLIGLASTSVPTLGGTLLVVPAVSVPVVLQGSPGGLGGTGWLSLPLIIPNNSSLAGLSLYFQALLLDSEAPSGVAMTAGLQMTIGV